MTTGLKVLAPGLHTTVQDLGRVGYQALGVPVSGALDGMSCRLANRLAGNPETAPVLEILLHGPTLEVVAESVRVALAGGDAQLELLGGRQRHMGGWRSLRLERGESFRVSGLDAAACCYLAIEGGIAVEPCLGSAATFVRGGLGGFEGRALRAGDLLPLAQAKAEKRTELRLAAAPMADDGRPIRVVLGPQDGLFTDAATQLLLSAEFRVSKDADRMGMRLEGPRLGGPHEDRRLAHPGGHDFVSDGIATGAIQVPASGQPILLLADHQTTGGYPKIATVISADLPLVGRRRPGSTLRFAAIDVAAAETLRREQEAEFQALVAEIAPAEGFDLESLYAANLISGVVSGVE